MNEQIKKKRRLLVVLPVIAIPFLTLLFWSMGGGKDDPDGTAEPSSGLNTNLPGAGPDDKQQDKLSLYDQALKDSLEMEEFRRADPYGKRQFLSYADSARYADSLRGLTLGSNIYYPGNARYDNLGSREAEDRLSERLHDLENQLAIAEYKRNDYRASSNTMAEVDQLQASLEAGTLAGSAAGAPDAELEKIDGILEKVMDIQNPGRAREKARAASEKNKGLVYSVSAPVEDTRADLFGNSGTTKIKEAKSAEAAIRPVTANFYELSGDGPDDAEENKAVPAFVHETQTLVSGATIKMRLAEQIFINGVMIPKGNYVFGTCQLEGERMQIEVKGIRYKNALFPVSLAVYDMDGITGIRIPGAIGRDATKQGADQVLQGLDIPMMDQSFGAQAASAGVQTVKSLFGRKAKLVRATVKAGYPVLLIDLNKRNQ